MTGMLQARLPAACLALALLHAAPVEPAEPLPYAIVDTAQQRCYDSQAEIPYPKEGAAFYGQDAQYVANPPRYKDNADGTVSDLVTGLMWQRDPGEKKTLGQAVAGASKCRAGGHDDWRLPGVKELQSIVDYTRSPDTTKSAAINPIFKVTRIENEGGGQDFPFYWTGTTHAGAFRASAAAYVAFGRSLGWMQDRRSGRYALLDVHGAGSQRSDPKVGDPSRFPRGRGPQGDVIRIYNHVRCVRGGGVTLRGAAEGRVDTPLRGG